ncbi:MAG: hypothetical protein JXA96_10580 [Sedimentisphaerales bacterium]|nr:hypothetical protein [Sedimentisphaerales bacterium]
MRKLKRAYRKNAKQRSNFKQKALTAGAVAAITFGVNAGIQKAYANDNSAILPDNHQKAVHQDSDSDLLSNSEEFAIGYDPFKQDQNKNGIVDGVELAQRVAKVVDALPVYVPNTYMPLPNETYKISHLMRGLETCDICGEYVNMGGYEIVNPKLNMTFPDPNDPLDNKFLPELAVHYMSHGSFDCFGEIHDGRVDIPRLLRVLEVQFPYESNEHQLAIEETDTDNDLLTDNEELSSGFNLNDSDQNNNLIPDGIEFAKQCAAAIDSLPEVDSQSKHTIYKESFMMFGLEKCDICGEYVNMGFFRITNATLGLSIEVPVITWHYMEHGSFSYSGDVHGKGRIDVALLKKILDMPQQCGDLGTIYSPADVNQDCIVDISDMTDFVEIWLNEINP